MPNSGIDSYLLIGYFYTFKNLKQYKMINIQPNPSYFNFEFTEVHS